MKPTEFIVETSMIAQEADTMHADHEVQMARADCYNAAKYAIELHKLLKNMSESQGLDGWVSEKITLANDYLRMVHEYLKYENVAQPGMMEFAESAADYAVDQLLAEVSSHDELNARPGMWRGDAKRMTAKGKPTKDELGMQDNLKNRIKASNKKGGLTGPKGVLPEQQDVAEAGPFSYGAKKPRKGSVADLAAKKRQEQEKDRQPAEPRDHMVGVARVVKGVAEGSRKIAEMATGGASGAGGVATSMSGPAHKTTSGVPKQVGNAHKPKKITVGKGVY